MRLSGVWIHRAEAEIAVDNTLRPDISTLLANALQVVLFVFCHECLGCLLIHKGGNKFELADIVIFPCVRFGDSLERVAPEFGCFWTHAFRADDAAPDGEFDIFVASDFR